MDDRDNMLEKLNVDVMEKNSLHLRLNDVTLRIKLR